MKSQWTSKFVAGSLTAIAGLGLVAVAGPTVAQASATPINMTWTVWGSTGDQSTYQARANLYTKSHPNVHIKVILLSNYDQQVETMIAAGKAPDLMNAAQDAAGLGINGALMNLGPLIQQSHFNLNRFEPGYIGEYQYRGQTYALPDRGGYIMMYYNKTMFKKAGIAPPTKNWTWTDFLNASKKLTVKKNGKVVQWGFAGSDWWPVYGSFVHQAGGHFLNSNESTSVAASAQITKAMSFVQALEYKYDVTPTAVEWANMGKGEGGDAAFGQGKVAMLFTGFWDIGGYATTKGLNFGIAPLPKNVQGGMETVGTGVGICNLSQNKQAAWQFLQWLSTKQGQMPIVTHHEDIPATKAAMPAWIKSLPKGVSYSALAAASKEVFSPRIPPTWNQVQTAEGNDLTAFWNGKATFSSIAQKLQQDINSALHSQH